jgi:hypothetical protein
MDREHRVSMMQFWSDHPELGDQPVIDIGDHNWVNNFQFSVTVLLIKSGLARDGWRFTFTENKVFFQQLKNG